MHRRGQSSDSFFRTIFLVGIAALMIVVFATAAFAQNSVPPTAVQAAKMPQYASRLVHPARRIAPPKSQVFARATKHSRPLDSNDIYDNGPINGNTDAWSINFGFIVSDSFTVGGNGTSITGMSFGAWLFPGDTVTSVEVSITSGENGGTSYFDQTVNFAQGSCSSTNGFGFNICTETGSFSGLTLNAGTYWVNLQNASVPSGDPVYWDENSGVGCTGQGCPSLASENSIGSIPSESFTILGSTTTTTTSTTYDDYACPGPQQGFHDLRNFSTNVGASGLAIGAAGKLYGTFANGGSYGAGLLYDVAQRAGNWVLTSLYSFLGGSNGSSPSGVIVGPQGALYGSAQGGLGYGLIYRATPPPTACATALCGWNETTVYEFTGGTDAVGGTVTAFDSAGNLYGIGGGGAYGFGAVFELSPSGGGWTEKMLYSFPGGNDGGGPNSLLLGNDGNLYGTAGGGTYGLGTVFELVPSGGSWTGNILYNFTGLSDGYSPGGLVQDSQGNLYGFSTCYTPFQVYCNEAGTLTQLGLIFEMSQEGGGWTFSIIYNAQEDCEVGSNLIHGIALNAAGELYAAEGGVINNCIPGYCYVLNCGEIVRILPHQVLITGTADIFGNVAADANGNAYGTASSCGLGTPQRNAGMIWQYSP